MPDWVGKPAIRRARRANLYGYLLEDHPNDVTQENDSLRLNCNHSVSIKTGWSGYNDFATGETGNAVECLVNYLGYDFKEAVAALAVFDGMAEEDLDIPEETTTLPGTPGSSAAATGATPASTAPASPQGPPAAPQAPPKPFVLPAPVSGPYRQMFAYLTQQRGIPAWLVQRLVDDGLLYQEAGHNNMVFVNQAQTYAELRGTMPGKPFHGIVPGSAVEDFRWFKPGPPASPVTAAFICEAAIDAMSLFLLRQRLPPPPGDNPMYCSIGGVANQQRIDMIKSCMGAAGRPVIIAVDNDDAGEKCRERNPDCFSIVPRGKDWNADLLAMGEAKAG